MIWPIRPKNSGVISRTETREAQHSAFTARIIVVTIAGFVVGSIWLATATTVPELVRAQGELIPSGHYQQVQSPEQGIVKKVLVEEGDIVEAGQILTVLASSELDQALGDVRRELTAQELRLQNLRLVAEFVGSDNDVVPSVLTEEANADLSFARNQLKLFAEQQAVQRKLKVHLVHTRKTLENARILTLKRIDERMKRVARAEALFAESLTPLRDVERQKDSLDQLQASLVEIDIRLSEAAKELGAASMPLEQNRIALLERVTKEAFDLEQSIAQLVQQKNAMEDRRRALEIRAPESGIIHAVSFPNPGEVIATGTTLFELLPSGPELVAQLKINPVDIGHIQQGDTVALKFDTFDPRRFGQIQGQITGVSPNSVLDEQSGNSHFRATVILESEAIGEGAWRRDLQAGMGTSAEIVTDERTVLAYLMKPIKRSLDSAFGER